MKKIDTFSDFMAFLFQVGIDIGLEKRHETTLNGVPIIIFYGEGYISVEIKDNFEYIYWKSWADRWNTVKDIPLIIKKG
jgi:hypothetical protein